LTGPDLPLLRDVVEQSSLPVLAAGGIRSSADLHGVAGTGCEGAIVGRALLDGSLPISAVASRNRRSDRSKNETATR
jgi:phosphoribosylformimino-5-aminoimidazole carboxamide ribonucleotide (ProFAR) isomerase